MTATIVQAKNAISEGTSCSVTLGSAPTNGNMLVAIVYTQQTSGGDAQTTAANWTKVHPYVVVPTWEYMYESGPWGQLDLFYKNCGALESTTQTPMTVATSHSYAVTMYEIGTPGGTFDEMFINVGPGANLTINAGNMAGIIASSSLPTMKITAPSDKTLLMLTQITQFNTLTAFAGTGLSGSVLAASATTVSGFPIGGASKNGAVSAYYDTVAPSTIKQLSGTPAVYGSYAFFAMIASLSGGGLSVGQDPITTTITTPAVQKSTFKYTIIT